MRFFHSGLCWFFCDSLTIKELHSDEYGKKSLDVDTGKSQEFFPDLMQRRREIFPDVYSKDPENPGCGG